MKITTFNFSVFLLSLFYISCSQTETSLTQCGPHGIPVEGSDECFCDLYYAGDNCETELREKFIGNWIAYDYQCSFGDSIPDGFSVEIVKMNDVSKVKIISPELFTNDSIISDVDFIGYLRHWEFKMEGNNVRRTFAIDIYHKEEHNELSVFIGRNEDLDEFTENCYCVLRKQ